MDLGQAKAGETGPIVWRFVEIDDPGDTPAGQPGQGRVTPGVGDGDQAIRDDPGPRLDEDSQTAEQSDDHGPSRRLSH